MTAEATRRGARALVTTCADLKPGESALVVSDHNTRPVGEIIEAAAREITDRVEHRVIAPFSVHGEDPPADIGALMFDADVIFGATTYSMAHSRLRLAANENGARYLSLADYSMEVLRSPALLADFRGLSAVSNGLARVLTAGREVRLTTALGTDLRCSVVGRSANAAPGWCDGPGTLASPPDAETNIAPLETESFGTIVVDGSIPCGEFGLLESPITLTVDGGRVVDIRGHRADDLNAVFDKLKDPKTRVIAELGIGLNPLAKLCGVMLEDEGCAGTAHLGIGSNATIGGTNSVPFHLDHIIRSVTIAVDGVTVVDAGTVLEEMLL